MKFVPAGVLLAMISVAASAGMVNSAAFVTVPTLDDVGLFLLIGLVGTVGGWLARRKKR